ncbi:hypothetical protein J4E86_001058 [Alternaria arbusti]|uniref:uncharacterized protein n=1 Tax=Alternaria arbusti TaxID=232088 RepID=UPI00221F84FC|nr:uncharacterized protein J4E86_001058 [Alternaria arbusti]KAI4962028.1 hypothetical protein J4E86_001058 [Alternaria arbusti]
MSGLEVAGIVLGALPLIISALEHYAQGVSTAKRFWHFKSELRFLLLRINTEKVTFVNTLEHLLTGIVRIDRMAEMLANVGGQDWQDETIEQCLKDRLRGAYEVYLANVQGMAGALQKIMDKLALGPDGKPPFSDLKLFKKEFQRLKFGLSKSEYTEQLNDLKTHNQYLSNLTKQSLELEPSRKKSKSSQCPNFRVLQEYARSLYETLKSGLRCGCSGHAVKLRLESRCQTSQQAEDSQDHTPFRVIFTDESVGTSSPRPISCNYWKWTEADIRYIADKPDKKPPYMDRALTSPKPLKTRLAIRNANYVSATWSTTSIENTASTHWMYQAALISNNG